MCGIAGFIQYHQAVGDQATLKQMGEAILHRGPDAGGEYFCNWAGLAHRRLSIIDLSEAGNQPMYSADNKHVLVFNGEIYNFPELRKKAEQKGYQFKTHTDSEVILALYAQYGEACVEQLNGMFAFAILNNETRQVFLARDRLGKKPLYYYDDGKAFIFASEIKSILQVPSVKREIRLDAVQDYLFYQYVPDPKTIFNNMHKLEPGHCLSISEKGTVKRQYWNLSFNQVSDARAAELTSGLLEQLDAATQSRMMSDVPLGAFLSGGVDSSGIVALMAQHSETPVKTCSIGFDAKRFDETHYARQVAEQYQTEHFELTVKDNLLNELESIAAFFDEPFADPSFVPTYFVSQLARQKVTVALAGDGGDECFAGYGKYAVDAIENKLRGYLPSLLRRQLLPHIARLIGQRSQPLLRKAHSLLNTLSVEPAQGFFLSNSFFKQSLWDSGKGSAFRDIADYHPSSLTREHYQQCDGHDHLSRILYTDFKTYLPGDILVKVDRMSMANSLEVRAPILDYKVVEYAAAIPSALKLAGKEKKHILKEAFKPLLSDEILYRKKMGFSVPLAQWMRQDLHEFAQSRLFAPSAGISRFFDNRMLKNIWNQHQSGKFDHSNELWSLLMFELWWKRYAA